MTEVHAAGVPPAPLSASAPRRPAGSFQAALAAASSVPAARPGGLGGARPWEAAPNPGFRARIAAAERSAEHAQHGYGQVNPRSGAMGRYQFLASTLMDLGWRDAQGGWTEVAARHGVRTDADFLASPAAQEAAFTAFLARTEAQLERNGAWAQGGGTIRALDGGELRLTEAGLVAAAHRRGAGTLARYLQHRSDTPDAALRPRERRAFEAVERRLRDFAEVGYASVRAPRTPVATQLALLRTD